MESLRHLDHRLPSISDRPHACGDNRLRGNRGNTNNGPSPHAWGQRLRPVKPSPPLRTIPTRVGTTKSHSPIQRPCPDHPHTRGDNRLPRKSRPMNCGPSPHAWGQRCNRINDRGQLRTIPTRVGTTVKRRTQVPLKADHPHTRGDNSNPFARSHVLAGPSPHAWGQPIHELHHDLQPRTIPTRVGTTPVSFSTFELHPDHPHTRGDNRPMFWQSHPYYGPSPHAWGQQTSFPCR